MSYEDDNNNEYYDDPDAFDFENRAMVISLKDGREFRVADFMADLALVTILASITLGSLITIGKILWSVL